MKQMFDMHCHIIPGVDDGARSMEEALNLIEQERSQGVSNIILTPHYRREMFESSEKLILQSYGELKAKVSELYPDMSLYLGCEYHVNMEMTEKLGERRQLRMCNTEYVLAEFSGRDSRNYVKERISALRTSGFKPIIAHCERYEWSEIAFLETLMNYGAMLQINADTVCGLEGFTQKQFAKKLMKTDLLDFVGSDGHNPGKRPVRIGAAAEYIEKKMGETYARKIFIENPQEILEG